MIVAELQPPLSFQATALLNAKTVTLGPV